MRDVILAFDDFVQGTGNNYSSAFAELALGVGEAYAIQCVVDAITSSDTTSFTVQLETSADGRNWQSKNASAEINAVAISPGQTKAAYAYDVGVFPGLALLRLRVALTGGAPSAHVKVWVRQTPNGYVKPSSVPGCVLWLRSDQGVTLQPGNAVSRWADLSGNGNDALQGTGAQQPIFAQASSSFNNLPTIAFDGTNDLLATAGFSLGVYTVLIVCNGQGATAGYFWTRSTGTANSDTIYGTTTNTSEVTRAGLLSAYNDVAGWGQWGTAAKVLIKQFDGTHAGHKLRLNAAAIATNSVSANNPGTTATTDRFVIAARADGFLPASFSVAEVAIFNASLLPFQITALEEYARRRYLLY